MFFSQKQFKSKTFWRQPWFLTIGAIVIFCLLGLAAYWPIFPGDSTRLPGCVCGDSAQSSWFLRWTPYALSHGLNPFFTSWVNVPFGANLAQNTLMPFLGLLAAPLTLLVSPVASFNLLAWLAFPLSATAMFYLVRRLTGSILASFVAGLLYGFSPYVAGQAAGHIMLSFIPIPPLIMLIVWKLFVEQKGRPFLLGLILAGAVIAQFLISPEVLAITALVVFLGIIVAAALFSSFATKRRLIFIGKGLLVTTVLSAICLAYPIWFMLFGSQHFTGPNFPANNPYRSDLVGLVVPTLNERFVPAMFHKIASETAGGNYPETGDYLGLPLLLFTFVAVVRWRRNRWLILSAIVAFVCWILSLGPRLVIYGHATSIPMPFGSMVHLPLLQNIIPGRLSLGMWLFVPIVVTLSIVEWQRDHKTKKARNNRLKELAMSGALVLLAISIVITLMPRWPYPSQPVNLPSAFSAGSQSIPAGTTVLAYPFPVFPADKAMLWQATNDMRFKLLGGYIQNIGPTGNQSLFPVLLSPPTVQEWLTYEQGNNTPWAQAQTISEADIKLFLRQNNVGAIMVDPSTVNAKEVASVFSRVLGPPKSLPGVLLWTGVQSSL